MSAATISEAYVTQFQNNVRHLAQQGDSRLRAHVYEEPLTGNLFTMERLAASTSVEKNGNFDADTVIATDGAWSRRQGNPDVFRWAKMYGHQDSGRMLVDPQGPYSQQGSMTMKREYDSLIVEAATVAATDGQGGSVAFPAGQIVGDGSATIVASSYDLIREANEKFQTNDIDPDEPKVFVVAPEDIKVMLGDEKLTSADYLSVKMLSANGMVQNFLGFTWIMSNRLDAGSSGNGPGVNIRRCLAFTRRGLALGVNYDIFARVSERPDKNHAVQVFLEWQAAAIRVEDEHVVHVLVDTIAA